MHISSLWQVAASSLDGLLAQLPVRALNKVLDVFEQHIPEATLEQLVERPYMQAPDRSAVDGPQSSAAGIAQPDPGWRAE